MGVGRRLRRDAFLRDLFGPRRVFAIGLVLLTGSSLLWRPGHHALLRVADPVRGVATGRVALVPPGQRHAYVTAYIDALDDLFLLGAIVCFAGALLSAVLVRSRDVVAHAPAEQPTG